MLTREDLELMQNPGTTHVYCDIGPYARSYGSVLGGLAHEIAHTLDVPHPPGCDDRLPTCDYGALMGDGYEDYPDTYFRDDDKETLRRSPFLSSTTPTATAAPVGPPTPAFTLSGTVTNRRMPGLAVAGAVVRIENGTRDSVTTDTDGRYRFLNVTGEVAVTAAAGPNSVPRTVRVAMDADRTVDFALDHEGTPPFSGTVFISPNILTPSDPTSLQAVEYTGRGERRIYDRRVDEWITVEAYLFKAQYRSGELEFQVNPEFGSIAAARAQVDVYAPALGRLPAVMLSRALKVQISAGDQLFGGNAYDRSFLIHTEYGEEMLRRGFLEEVLFHEAGHISLDLDHAGAPGWLAAQEADEVFISNYARDHPEREDIAETMLVYFAVRYRPERLSTEDRSKSVFANIESSGLSGRAAIRHVALPAQSRSLTSYGRASDDLRGHRSRCVFHRRPKTQQTGPNPNPPQLNNRTPLFVLPPPKRPSTPGDRVGGRNPNPSPSTGEG